MVESILLFLIFIVCIICTPKKYKTIANPVFIFTLLWAMIMEISREQIYGLYPGSNETRIIIAVGVIFFVIGYILSLISKNFKFNNSKKVNDNEYSYQMRYYLLYTLAIICIIYYIPNFIKSMILLFQGNSMNTIRTLTQSNNTNIPINNLISNFIILPSATALEVLAVADFWAGKRDKKLFIFTVILIVLRIISDAGRTPLINLVIYMVIGYFITHRKIYKKNSEEKIKNNKDKKLIKKYGIVGGIIILITSISRASSTLLRQICFYFGMSPIIFTNWKEAVDVQGLVTYGLTSLNGLFFSIVYFIKNIFNLQYPALLKSSYDMIALTDSFWVDIAQGGIKANAYVSAFWFFYTDGRIIGVILGMLLYGWIVSKSFINVTNKQNIKNISIFLILFQGMFMSFIRFPFAKPYYVLGILIIIFFVYKPIKKDKNENEGNINEHNKAFNYNENTIIYVLCPAFNKTGGTELAHQLIYELNSIGASAYITYYGDNEEKINPAFKKYVSEYKNISEIVDDENNILIIPEIKQEIINDYKNIQKAVWWMSVDNYLKRNGFIGYCKFYGILKGIKHVLNGDIKIAGTKINKDIVHLYQSEYAHKFLLDHDVTNTYRLSDYINQEYLNTNSVNNNDRKDNVLYNPKKGMEFTKKLIKRAPDINWIPIENMTTEEVHSLLLNSKVYIDFGNHPGKDRFPREAAISGCCVITSKNGSAAFYEDVPIDDEFKYDDNNKNIDKIIIKIKDCLLNYEENNLKFENYRKFISSEYETFKNDVISIINNKQKSLKESDKKSN